MREGDCKLKSVEHKFDQIIGNSKDGSRRREREEQHSLQKMSRNKEYALPWRQGGTFTGGAIFHAPSLHLGLLKRGSVAAKPNSWQKLGT